MKFQDYEKAFSKSRLSSYLATCGLDRAKAVELYYLNIELSAELYKIIGITEVILRNAINSHYEKQFGKDWLMTESGAGFLSKKECKNSVKAIAEAVQKMNSERVISASRTSPDSLVAELNFGFWIYLFRQHQFIGAGSTLLEIFPELPPKTTQALMFKLLYSVKSIRNRIAHHEPICFDRRHISTKNALVCYQNCLEITAWLGFNPTEIWRETDSVRSVIQQIELLMKG